MGMRNNGLTTILLAALLCLLTQPEADAAPSGKKDGKKSTSKKQEILASRKEAREGLAFYRQKNYDLAIEKLSEAARLNPLDASVQYFLGLAAIKKGDFKTAEKALSRVIVMLDPKDTYAVNARKCFENCRKEFDRIRPYSCVFETRRFLRWADSSMPLKVYLSQGLELPKGYSGGDLTKAKMKELTQWLADPKFVKHLKPLRHFRQEYADAVKSGLGEWAWADTEGVVKHEITDDPTRAQILVFYCSKLYGQATGVTIVSNQPREPVIIQFPVEHFYQLPLHQWPTLIRSMAAHEFGHAFGLAHSDFKRDIMYPTDKIKYVHRGMDQSGPNIVTQNDAATLRALYELPAPILK
jgi:hypothetical protein